MSVEGAAATVATPIVERPVACISDTCALHVHYLSQFEHNYRILMTKMSELRSLKVHVKRRVEVDEASQQMKRTPVVAQWLVRVEEFEPEVDVILQRCSGEIEQRCCGDYCPKNWWSRYKLGKKVCKKLEVVAELKSQGNFDVVADKTLPTQVQEQPEDQNVGMDEILGEVWSWFSDDQVKIVGIYGMGGVGKTTLLGKINNMFQEEAASKFDVVIWVVVSSQVSLPNIQRQIGKRLGLTWSEDDDQNDKAESIYNVLMKKKFLLLLDDVWKRMDLKAIGIPSPLSSRNNSKIVFTTRSEKVCGAMEVNKKYKVPVLKWEQAWELFQQKVGEEALNSHSEILEVAKAVAGECGGLPLALITTGRAMATKKTPPEWTHALTTLKRYAAEFADMEEEVLVKLKFSYDSLEDATTMECFLYCSLYPEDYHIAIEDVIHKWVGEGFLDKFEDLDDAVNMGHSIIGTLKAACLLESSSVRIEDGVKMHDVVRDLALWIARECGKDDCKFLVEAGIGSAQSPSIERWRDAERISLMSSSIRELSSAPECPRLLTLLLQHSRDLSIIHADFFRCMRNLRVLDLSFTGIRDVPKSIGGLLELQYLNLSETRIRTVPRELGNLVKLRFLDLSWIEYLRRLPDGMISSFPSLQMLNLNMSFDMDSSFEAELESLEKLRDLRMYIKEASVLQRMPPSQRVSSCISDLGIYECKGLTELALASSLLLGKTEKLHQIVVEECSDLEKLTINCLEADEDGMGPLLTLGVLEFRRLWNLKNIMWSETTTHIHFKRLYKVTLSHCGGVKDLSWLVLVPLLRHLVVSYCDEVEEIIVDRFATIVIEDHNVFSRVVEMTFADMPKLKSITTTALSFPCLKKIRVFDCPLLKKLPFASNNINRSALPQIGGKALEWWDALEWEDQTIKSILQPGFVVSDW